MRKSMMRVVAISAVCASFIGLSAMASAQGHYRDRDRDWKIERRIDKLQVEKDKALYHHNYKRARNIQIMIDAARDELRHKHW